MTSKPSEVEHRTFTIAASDGERIHCDARFSAGGAGPMPVVIFSHGFKGFKNWGSIPFITESLAAGGFYAIAFNFTHNGVEGDSAEFTRLDKFERNTFSREVRELAEVIAAVKAGAIPEPDRAARERLGTIGHSRGGGITLLEAHRDPGVSAVAVWASVATFDRYIDSQKARWRADGYFESKNMRTGQMMRLGTALLDEAESGEFDICDAAARLARPLLILHGEQDISVRIEDGEQIARCADPLLTEYVALPRTNHTFGAEHPFTGPTQALQEAIGRTVGFFREHLSPPTAS